MTFKNKRGEVPWYVIGLVLALIVMLVSVGAVIKLRKAQDSTNQATKDTCTGLTAGTCDQGPTCPEGKTRNFFATCPDTQICCMS
jgi:hypothetical protein